MGYFLPTSPLPTLDHLPLASDHARKAPFPPETPLLASGGPAPSPAAVAVQMFPAVHVEASGASRAAEKRSPSDAAARGPAAVGSDRSDLVFPGRCFSLSVPQWPHLCNGEVDGDNNDATFRGCCWIK